MEALENLRLAKQSYSSVTKSESIDLLLAEPESPPPERQGENKATTVLNVGEMCEQEQLRRAKGYLHVLL